MTCCEINDCAQISKTVISVRHFGLGGRESLKTAVTIVLSATLSAVFRYVHLRSKNFKILYL